MRINFSNYVRNVFSTQQLLVWGLVTGAASVLAYLGMPTKMGSKMWSLAVVLVLGLLWRFIWSGYRFFQAMARPLKILNVVEGKHYNKGKCILILERSPWIREGQLMTLHILDGDAKEPLGLLTIQTFTDAGYPQAILEAYFGPDRPIKYLGDGTRRSSLRADSLLSREFLRGPIAEGGFDVRRQSRS